MKIFQIKNMKQIANILLTTLVLLLTSCGGNKNTTEEKKATLADLKKQVLTLNAQIGGIEKELNAAGQGEVAKSIFVGVSAIVTQDFTHYIELTGKVESESISFITPRAGGGQVRELFIKRGDMVRKGQAILQLDNSLIKQSTSAAANTIETFKAQASLAKAVYEKQKSLWEQNIGSEIQLMTAKTNAEASASQLRAATEQLGLAKDQLAYTTVRSDVDGVAEEVNVKVGDLFGGGGQIKIVNTQKLKVTTQVPENYAGRIKVGTEASLNFTDIQKVLAAKLSVVGSVIDPLNRSFYVETKLPIDKNFRPNQLVQVKIKDYAHTNAVVIPINILQIDDKGKFIYIAVSEKGKLVARKKEITVGEFYGNDIEVLAGLSAGDQIITEGYQSLYDGLSITISNK